MNTNTMQSKEEASLELVSAFPKPPAYFQLFENEDTALSPPQPMSPTYHLFGMPYSTKVRKRCNRNGHFPCRRRYSVNHLN